MCTCMLKSLVEQKPKNISSKRARIQRKARQSHRPINGKHWAAIQITWVEGIHRVLSITNSIILNPSQGHHASRKRSHAVDEYLFAPPPLRSAKSRFHTCCPTDSHLRELSTQTLLSWNKCLASPPPTYSECYFVVFPNFISRIWRRLWFFS